MLQWLNDVVARERQKQNTNIPQHQYDLSLVTKMTSFCNQLSNDTQGFRNCIMFSAACECVCNSYTYIPVVNDNYFMFHLPLLWFFIIIVFVWPKHVICHVHVT